ncbi:hypothetical protein NCCP1664_15010 [Zafaria cholistanensis]|uniref:Uncharacterized protein n=1 Tax=Zafaria cholistanensis TaxID=1682741 RepID=A0A5A7NQI2_9MICC|nr:hypothetical protein [Zafaria cholistanensis]GER23005.1 hypothetical protein NCCP1664_15010 [Zafaria cholistanensis]
MQTAQSKAAVGRREHSRRLRLVPEVARPRHGRAEVWVESPLQLLSAVEAHGAGLLGSDTVIHPRGGTEGLDSTLQALVAHAPPGISFADAGLKVPPASRPGIDRWVTGDAYSGRIQRALLGPVAAQEVVIVDDGLATLKLLDMLTADRPVPLIRPRGRAGLGRRALGLATWHHLRLLARHGRLMAFTALPVPICVDEKFRALGGHLEHHRFEWLASQPVPETFHEPTIVVGSALASDGLVDVEAYLGWVMSLAEDGPVAYFPHRRERPDFLARLAGNPMIRVQEHTVPVEMRLRGLRPGQTVRALPSTVLPSLRLLLAPNGVAIKGHPVPDPWWTPAATPALRAHLTTSLG